MKKIINILSIIIMILMITTPVCYGGYSFVETDFNIDEVKEELNIITINKETQIAFMNVLKITTFCAVIGEIAYFVRCIVRRKKIIHFIGCTFSIIGSIAVFGFFLNANQDLAELDKIYVVEADWNQAGIYDKRMHDYDLYKTININDTDFRIVDMDDEGVTLEYTRQYYEGENIREYSIKEEVVNQKLLWNVNYEYVIEKSPILCVDGGTRYYCKCEKRS